MWKNRFWLQTKATKSRKGAEIGPNVEMKVLKKKYEILNQELI